MGNIEVAAQVEAAFRALAEQQHDEPMAQRVRRTLEDLITEEIEAALARGEPVRVVVRRIVDALVACLE
jgi:hypothetical protein